MPPSGLSASQLDTLQQLQAITARGAEQEEDSVGHLEQVGWDLQAAISRIYDGVPSSSRSAPVSSASHSYPPSRDNGGVDDSLLPSPTSRTFAAERRRPSGTGGLGTGAVGLYYLRQALAVPITILSWPAGLIYNLGAVLLSFLARLFRLRPSTASFRPRNPFSGASRPRTILSPSGAAEAFIRSVENASGLSCSSISSSAGASGVQVGSSSGLSRRGGASAREEQRLPAFFVGGYEQALRKARDERRVLMVVLTSEENEADGALKRDIIPDPVLVNALEEENVLIWGGDVGERDAYQVGQTLSYITLPFLAFISLQPTPTSPHIPINPSTASLTAPRMRLLTRLEPRSSATSHGPLTAPIVVNHLTTSVLPKAKPFLTRLKAQDLQRVQERADREASERRVAEIARRDEEKVLAVRRREAEKQKEEQRRREAEERAALKLAEKERVAGLARKWREWKRGELARRGEGQGEGAVRMVVRLGDGRRVMRTFGAGEGTEELYGWVECELSAKEDGVEQGEARRDEPPAGYDQHFHFRLATAFPRWVLPFPHHLTSPSASTASLAGADSATTTTVGEAFQGQGSTVNLVVDGLEERRRMSMSSRGEDGSDEEEEEEEED
ncbi:hypothetical protein JCM11251_006817 [Rhodosporidiobolus azoricus]